MRAHFFRAHGEIEGRRAYDRFTTSLANRQSRDAYDNTGFCRNAEMLGRLAVASDPRGVLALASDLEERPYGVEASCDEVMDRPRMRQAVLPDAPLPDAAPLAAPVPQAELAPADEERNDAGAEPLTPVPLAAVDRAPPPPVAGPMAEPVAAPAPLRAEAPLPAPVAVAVVTPAPVPAPTVVPAVAVAPPVAAPAPAPIARPVAAHPDPAAALAAAADALKAAAEAMRDANAAPADAAPVIRERLPAAKKL